MNESMRGDSQIRTRTCSRLQNRSHALRCFSSTRTPPKLNKHHKHESMRAHAHARALNHDNTPPRRAHERAAQASARARMETTPHLPPTPRARDVRTRAKPG
eukprot:6190896-Pleurochrysis_carterae.AAC.1